MPKIRDQNRVIRYLKLQEEVQDLAREIAESRNNDTLSIAEKASINAMTTGLLAPVINQPASQPRTKPSVAPAAK